jgi:hypothetical protein
MRAAPRSRNGWIVAASLAVHAAILTVLALHAPRLRVPHEASGPPEAVIPVLIMPRTPPPAAAPGARPQPIRLHRRPQRFVPEETPVAPIVAPSVETKAPAPSAAGPRTLTLPAPEDAVATNARQALRAKLGCSSANLLNLSRAEREKCEEQLAAGAKQADYLGTGIDADKAGGLAAAARRKEADYRYMRGVPSSNGTAGAGPSANGNAVGRGNNLPGRTSEEVGKIVGSDKPTATIPF